MTEKAILKSSQSDNKKQLKILLIVVGSFVAFGLILVTAASFLVYTLVKTSLENEQKDPTNQVLRDADLEDLSVSNKRAIRQIRSADSTVEVKSALNNNLKSRNIVVSTSSNDTASDSTISGNSLASGDLENFKTSAQILVVELSKYDRSLLRLARVEKIVFLSDLKLDYNGEKSEVTGLASVGYDTLFLNTDVLSIESTDDFDYAEFANATIHHELFHLMDWNLGNYNSDKKWTSLNPKSFTYNDDLVSNPQIPDYYDDAKPRGFVSGYARQNAQEDKAETFAFLMVEPYRKDLLKRMNSDVVLRKKVRYMQLEVFENSYSNTFDGLFRQ